MISRTRATAAPRRFYDQAALKFLGSDYRYNKADVDFTRFYPVRRHSTLAAHLQYRLVERQWSLAAL